MKPKLFNFRFVKIVMIGTNGITYELFRSDLDLSLVPLILSVPKSKLKNF